jgi:hypothetical protein
MNMQALSSGNSTDEKDWSKLKLKWVKCTCLDGKKGNSLRCSSNGDLENCSVTQQGSNACYKAKITGINMLCQGSGITYD